MAISTEAIALHRYVGKDLAVRAYETIRDTILTGGFAPADQLAERELVARFGFSRTPIRQALRQLAAEGLAEAIPRVGVFVRKMTLAEADELLEFRRALEAAAAMIAARKIAPHEIEALEELAQHVDEMAVGGDGHELQELDLRFHREVMRIAGNRELERRASSVLMIYWGVGFHAARAKGELPVKSMVVPHADVAKAIASRNVAQASQVMWDHFAPVEQYLHAEIHSAARETEQ